MRLSTFRSIAWGVALLALAVSPLAADPMVRQGVDLWTTVSGVSYASFEHDPIPADFFCAGSQPFAGTIAFHGTPVATEPADSLGPIDTIVRRLDDAVFDEDGVARTRIQLLVLSLQAVEPVETECGRFEASVVLDGEQPTTEMEIRRTSVLGGTYVAPLELHTKMVFQPLDADGARTLELPRTIELDPAPNSVWSWSAEERYEGAVWVDTDGDRKPDTLLPPASNFQAGVQLATYSDTDPSLTQRTCGGYPVGQNCPVGLCPSQQCHCTPCNQNPEPGEPSNECEHLHCLWICVDCFIIEEPFI